MTMQVSNNNDKKMIRVTRIIVVQKCQKNVKNYSTNFAYRHCHDERFKKNLAIAFRGQRSFH